MHFMFVLNNKKENECSYHAKTTSAFISLHRIYYRCIDFTFSILFCVQFFTRQLLLFFNTNFLSSCRFKINLFSSEIQNGFSFSKRSPVSSFLSFLIRNVAKNFMHSNQYRINFHYSKTSFEY